MSADSQPSLVFIDVEASGLHDRSYPIEVAWADLDLRVGGLLIRPMKGWDERDWSVESERIHNIPRATLFSDGVPAAEAAARINAALTGRVVLSDAPAFDGGWLWRLFNDTGVEPGFGLANFDTNLAKVATRNMESHEIEALKKAVSSLYPHTHRAGPDALQMAAMWRAVSDPTWRGRMLGAAIPA